jgi:5-methylcytosine-specific restriction endonuclease McrA
MNDNMKCCPNCEEWKNRGEFSRDKCRKDSLQVYCKACNRAYLIAHRKERAAYDAFYKATHHKENAANSRRRRTRERGSGGTHTAQDVQRQGDSQKWKCWWCSKPCTDNYHVDHLVPLARGGHNDPSNIVITCPRCNCSKNDKLPQEWIGRLL